MRKGSAFESWESEDDEDGNEILLAVFKDGTELPESKVSIADWRAHPDSVAESLNRQLAEHGLEIVEHETDSDFYAFTIAKKGG